MRTSFYKNIFFWVTIVIIFYLVTYLFHGDHPYQMPAGRGGIEFDDKPGQIHEKK